MNQGLFVMNKIENIGLPEVKLLVKDVTNLYIGSATVVSRVVAEINVKNKSNEAPPQVFTHQLVVLTYSEFCCVICTQKERLLESGWSLRAIDDMDQEHQYLVCSAAAKPALHDALDACNDDVSFDDGWSIVKVRFESLCHFVGGITSVFPGTDQVER